MAEANQEQAFMWRLNGAQHAIHMMHVVFIAKKNMHAAVAE
jgi:hypothetical protein